MRSSFLTVCGVALAALLLLGGPAAAHCGSCPGDHAKAEETDNKTEVATVGCPFTAAEQARDKSLQETGCAKTAGEVYRKTLADGVYAKTLATSGCVKTATKAAYDAVLEKSGCAKSASAAAQHAAAQAAYDKKLQESGCKHQAQAAYDEAKKAAAEQLQAEPEKAAEVSS